MRRGRLSAPLAVLWYNPLMSIRWLKFIPFGVVLALAAMCGADSLTNVHELAAYLQGPRTTVRSYAVEGLVTSLLHSEHGDFVLENGDLRMWVSKPPDASVAPGDWVRVSGRIYPEQCIWENLGGKTLVKLGTRTIPPPVQRTLAQLQGNDCHLLRVRTEGFVQEIFQDDVDARYCIFRLQDGDLCIHVSAQHENIPQHAPQSLLGSRISLTGRCLINYPTARRFYGRRILMGPTDRITVLQAADPLRLPAPPLERLYLAEPDRVARIGQRSLVARVEAQWHGDRLLVRSRPDTLHRIDLASDVPLPPVGSSVTVVGTVETDLFRVNLSHAHIISVTNGVTSTDPPRAPRPLESAFSGSAYNAACFGTLLTAEGTVRALPLPKSGNGILTLACRDRFVSVDVSGCPSVLNGLEVGSTVSITGVCIFDTENWRPTLAFPRITDMLLVPRTDADIVLLARPPWWTPERLALVVTALLVVLLLVGAWGVSVHKIAERRGRALAQAAISQAESDLKVCERTRLAVELHDSISQNLTGAVIAMRVAAESLSGDRQTAEENLRLAMKTVDSSREELRNCIWDLRNQTLEEVDIDEAIRRTLEPHIAGCALTIRFNVPRERISDNTAHAILCTIRELCVNARRHGQATEIRIAGAIEDGQLLFSVRDNGCGFDPAACPGVEQGHFGLQGIRERIREFGGTVNVSSAPGHGAKVTVSLNIPHPYDS